MRLFIALVFLALLGHAAAGLSPAYVCSACAFALGLIEQAALQVRLEGYLKAQCDGSKVCEASVHQLILATVAQVNPDDICSPEGLNVCPG